MTVTTYTFWCLLFIFFWLATYRLPFNKAARRKKIALYLADKTKLPAETAFAYFGTILYLGLAILTITVLTHLSKQNLQNYLGHFSLLNLILLPLTSFTAIALNALTIPLLYKIKPTANIPKEISKIPWIAAMLVLPKQQIWLIPAIAALLEETVFRATIFLGLQNLGASFTYTLIFSTFLFTFGQIVLVSNFTQIYVLGTSSIILAILGCLLTQTTHSIIPAIILHASFASFFTQLSHKQAQKM